MLYNFDLTISGNVLTSSVSESEESATMNNLSSSSSPENMNLLDQRNLKLVSPNGENIFHLLYYLKGDILKWHKSV